MDIYGVIGYPIKHSLSPAMHNAAFKKLGIDARYLTFEVSPKDLEIILKGIFKAGIKGLNVTVPHKEACMASLDRIDSIAEAIGAVNTIVLEDSELVGFNTDAHGFLAALKEDLDFEAGGKSIFILGSGGASRAVGFSLAERGAREIRITDLFLERAERLSQNIKTFYPSCNVRVLKAKKLYNQEDVEGMDLLINATPIGLKKNDPLLFDNSVFRKGDLLVYDLVYNPRKTKLIETANRFGLKASGGLGMLLYQGASSFELWTGRRAPIEVMKRALNKAIGV